MPCIPSIGYILQALLLSSSGVAGAPTLSGACSSGQSQPSNDGGFDSPLLSADDSTTALSLVQLRATAADLSRIPGDSLTNPDYPVDAEVQACKTVPGMFIGYAAYNEALARFDSGLFVEIGAFLGESSCYMAQRLMATNKAGIQFDVIDLWGNVDQNFASWVDVNHADWTQTMRSHGQDAKDTWSYFMRKTGSRHRLRNVVQGSSEDLAVVNSYEDGSISYLYLDTSHAYDPTLNELRLWWPKIKNGGSLCGDDYADMAVERAVKDSGIPFRLVYSKRGIGFEETRPNFCMDKPQ